MDTWNSIFAFQDLASAIGKIVSQVSAHYGLDLENTNLVEKDLIHTSAASKLNFGVNGSQFTSGIFDFHLPINTPLSIVDVG